MCVVLLCSHGLIPVLTSRSLPFRWRKTDSGGRECSVPLHSYQLSRLMRLDWIIGINQGYSVKDTGDKQGLYCTSIQPAGSLLLEGKMTERHGWIPGGERGSH